MRTIRRAAIAAASSLVLLLVLFVPPAQAHTNVCSNWADEKCDFTLYSDGLSYANVTTRGCLTGAYGDVRSVSILNKYTNASFRLFHVEVWAAEPTPHKIWGPSQSEVLNPNESFTWLLAYLSPQPDADQIYVRAVMEGGGAGGGGGVEVVWRFSPYHPRHSPYDLVTKSTFPAGTHNCIVV